MGRKYHLIATGCKDGFVRIFKATEQENGDLKIETLAKLNDHKLEVWRVSWNMTGTILHQRVMTEITFMEMQLFK